MIIVLDWDGTLVDSADAIVQCMSDAAASVGLPVPSPTAVRQIIGLGLPEAVRSLFPAGEQEQLAELTSAYSHHYRARPGDLPPLFPGVEQTLAALLDAGYLLAVATGKSRRGLDRELQRRELGDLFQVTRCADETASKPDPQMLVEILDEAGFGANQAVMVGDTEFDMLMARRAGVRKIAVTYGAHSRLQLSRCEPDLLVDEFSTILDWVNGGFEGGKDDRAGAR